MILGVAQLVVNLARLEDGAGVLEDAGYELLFEQRGLASHDAKAPFQSASRRDLDMAHFTAPDATVAIELTAYGGEPPSGACAYRLEPSAGEGDADGGLASHLAARTPGAAAALVLRGDLERSGSFWCEALGFAELSRGHGAVTLAPRAPLPSLSISLTLTEASPKRGATTVDARGCVLMTVLTTSIEDDLALVGAHDAALRFSPCWDERVAGRPIRAALVEGPSGELIELLQAPRGDSESGSSGVATTEP